MRRRWEQWVGFTRMYGIRAGRKMDGKEDYPWKPINLENKDTMKICFLNDLIKEFDDYTQKN